MDISVQSQTLIESNADFERWLETGKEPAETSKMADVDGDVNGYSKGLQQEQGGWSLEGRGDSNVFSGKMLFFSEVFD